MLVFRQKNTLNLHRRSERGRPFTKMEWLCPMTIYFVLPTAEKQPRTPKYIRQRKYKKLRKYSKNNLGNHVRVSHVLGSGIRILETDPDKIWGY